jgi:hypothetical protein
MKTLKFNSLFLLIVILALYACGDDPKPIPKSSAKNVITFTFNALTPEVTGTISDVDKKIALTVPAGTAVTALTPKIVVSDKASVSPQSGVAQNFTNLVTYTVTAEDGSTRAYEVTVTFAPAKSTAKNITAFKFADLTPEVLGTIDEANKKITATVPNGTDVTKLTPSISISEKATVSPVSNLKMNFGIPITYTVTAEDGSTQAYEVTVIIDPTVSFTIEPYINGLEIEQGGLLILHGTGFGSAVNNKVILADVNDSRLTYAVPASLVSTDELMIFSLPSTIPRGDYKIQVFVDAQSTFMDEVFTITYPRPVIGSVEPATVVIGENITITGLNFGSENEVKLTSGQQTFALDVISETSTKIEAKVPVSIRAGNYSLTVISNGKEGFFDESITVAVPANTPYITEITDTSLARGETMIIRGGNLKKIGVATNINFLPWPNGGTTQVRSAVANDEGTEVTFVIPNDFPTGTYTIEVEVDFEYSDEYDEVIQIN